MWIPIDPFCYRNALVLEDNLKNTLGILLTHMPDAIPDRWINMTSRIIAHFYQELHPDSSKRPKYDFRAMHLHHYNRYTEQVSVTQIL
jgi:hypothetical protein